MTRLIAALAFVLLLAGCTVFEPAEGEPEGVTLTFEDGVFELVADPPVLRSFLRVPGEDLAVEHEDCDVVNGAVECIFGVTASETIPVEGDVRLTHSDGSPLDLGVVCRDDCYALRLSE